MDKEKADFARRLRAALHDAGIEASASVRRGASIPATTARR